MLNPAFCYCPLTSTMSIITSGTRLLFSLYVPSNMSNEHWATLDNGRSILSFWYLEKKYHPLELPSTSETIQGLEIVRKITYAALYLNSFEYFHTNISSGSILMCDNDVTNVKLSSFELVLELKFLLKENSIESGQPFEVEWEQIPYFWKVSKYLLHRV